VLAASAKMGPLVPSQYLPRVEKWPVLAIRCFDLAIMKRSKDFLEKKNFTLRVMPMQRLAATMSDHDLVENGIL